jgi:DNA-binding NtrC family response regulator
MKSRILIVDDDRQFVARLRQVLEGRYEVESAHSVEEFSERFSSSAFDLVVLDMRLETDREGLELLKLIRSEHPTMPVLMVTGYPDLDTAVEAMKAGAVDYVRKERVDLNALSKIVDSLLREGALRSEVDHLRRRIETLDPAELIGESPAIIGLREKIETAAQDGEATVLIRGESGTGKELVAESIHRTGVRKFGPFVRVLIAGLHRESLHSDLFGHERGAYTGATNTRKGCIELAHRGVLFLDEIGDMDIESQVKLLDVIESHRFRRLGSNREISADVQFLAATHRNMEALIREGKFREDLYYRLRRFEITVLPLRERPDDIMALATHFLKQLTREGRTTATEFSPEVAGCFLEYPWPGNVRELKNVVEYGCMQARSRGDKEIEIRHLPVQFETTTAKPPELIGPSSSLNVHRFVARAELELLSEGMRRHGEMKNVLAQTLGYSDRFTFRRRIQRILDRYPELRAEFPKISEIFGTPEKALPERHGDC